MMISRRPVSSPGQVEKYPPPFMGFMKSNSNGGSRSKSRGRSRASPLFVRRNKSSAAAVTQEPSSPKVTCMGQVRVRRSKPKIQPENPTRKRCEWIRNGSFRNGLAGKIKSSSFWPKWKLFTFPCSRQKKPKSVKDSPVSQLNRPVTESSVVVEELNEEEEHFKIPKLIVSPASSTHTPPMNALLLTRSRSAPYSSSSLAFRFWEENNEREAEARRGREQSVRSESANSKIASGVADEKMNGAKESEANIDGNEVGRTELGCVRRPELTRSKSAPARIGEKMVCFWMKKKVRQGLGLSRD